MSSINIDWFHLTKNQLIVLTVYFVVFMILGFWGTIVALLHNEFFKSLSILQTALIGNISIALMGSTIFYTRKIYKICLNVDALKTDSNYYKNFGSFMYFMFRPIYSIGFAILIVLMIKAGVIIVTTTEPGLDSKFIFFSMFISFFVGFGAGDFIDYLEEKGVRVFNDFIKKKNNG